jgi:hypothetical protein
MPRLATLIACLLLAVPAAASAQGAGDDQYQDPFGEPTAQNGSGGGGDSDGGLSDEPPVPSDDDDDAGSGGGTGGGGTTGGGGGTTGSGTTPSTGTTPTPPAAEATDQLPNTGSEPLLIMGLGVAFVLTGAGLRLRTIDPDAF